MKTVEHWFWWITDERTGKLRKTAWRMAAAEATRDPRAVPVEGSLELRVCPESPADHALLSTSGFLGGIGRVTDTSNTDSITRKE